MPPMTCSSQDPKVWKMNWDYWIHKYLQASYFPPVLYLQIARVKSGIWWLVRRSCLCQIIPAVWFQSGKLSSPEDGGPWSCRCVLLTALCVSGTLPVLSSPFPLLILKSGTYGTLPNVSERWRMSTVDHFQVKIIYRGENSDLCGFVC